MPYAVLYPVFTGSRPVPVPSGPSQSILGPASFSAKSFPCHTYEKCACKSFHCHTYKNKGLKVLCLPHLRKRPGGGGSFFPQKLPPPFPFWNGSLHSFERPLSPTKIENVPSWE